MTFKVINEQQNLSKMSMSKCEIITLPEALLYVPLLLNSQLC